MTTNQLQRVVLPLIAVALFLFGCLDIGTAAGWEDPLTGRGILAFAAATLAMVLLAGGVDRLIRKVTR